jgi:hypothetical protein
MLMRREDCECGAPVGLLDVGRFVLALDVDPVSIVTEAWEKPSCRAVIGFHHVPGYTVHQCR